MATTFSHQFQLNFFKIITVRNLHEGKLMIPNKFVRKYGGSLPNTLFLKTPNGAEWKMTLEKRDGKIWFQKGWKEFAEYHTLAHGHLLVFRCKRTSHFQVHIFDLSALEIDYPSKRTSNNQGNKPPNDENLECPRPGQKRKGNSVEFFRTYQLRSRNCVKVESNTILPKEALHHTDTKCKGILKVTANQVTPLDRASSFKSCNPFFLVVMHQSYVGSYSNLLLPSKFCMNHFDLQEKQRFIVINLEVSGRVWHEKCLIFEENKTKRFRLKWRAFVEDNNLKVGDVCTFELIHGTKLTFLVHIFRQTDRSICSTSQESRQFRGAC